ncbi:neuronal acetylcholine receptor subunit alpha-6-like [Mya arenaria]|uniref:neuronal acetylcholine receptor subunit alpha-6-like n=1 Tax=Mya arenaria TaxID=6604 RepID=UPI0022E1E21D|nr:neuronal acetylcholine receptor subunit alpha-6-like [Mya arenaria]
MVPVSEVWYPPLIIGNPDTTSTAIKVEDRSYVWLGADGTIMFYPSGVYSVNSPLDSKYYPFDKQTFNIQFVLNGFTNTQVNLIEGKTNIVSSFEGNGEWSLLNSTRNVTVLNQYTPVAQFTVILERKSTFMVVNIILPIVFLAVINLLVFVLPPDAGERVSFSVTLLLSLAVFMTLVGDNLPKTSDPLPVLSYYLLATLTLSTLMCVMAMLNLSIYHKNEQSRPPKCIAVVAAAVLCRNTFHKSQKVKDIAETDTNPTMEKQGETMKVAFEDKEVTLSWKDEINELTGKVSVTGTLELIWKDEELVWDPADFNYIYSMMVPVSEVWYPPLIIGNPDTTATAFKVEDRSCVRLSQDGTISFYPSGVYSVNSPLDSKYYPFDKQTFGIQFLVPGFINTEVNLIEGSITYIASSFEGDGGWSVLNMTRAVSQVNQYTPVATFTVSLERKSTFMVVNIILPIVFLAINNLLVFVLPPDAGERVSYSVTLLLSLAVFMTLLGDNLPKTSDPLPVHSYYLLATLTLSTPMCVMAILNLTIYHKNEQSRPPKCISVVAGAVLCRNTFLKSQKVKDIAEEADTFAFEHNKEVTLSWKDVSYAVDILCLVAFIIVMFVINIYYLVQLTSQ